MSSESSSNLKIRVDKTRCVGNARCWSAAPDVFRLDDEGYIAVSEINVAKGFEKLARRGARACPERVIEILEDDAHSDLP